MQHFNTRRSLVQRFAALLACGLGGLLVDPAATVGQTPFSLETSAGNGADSFVRLGQATTNFGAGGSVVIKDSGGGSTTRKGYLRFDVSSLSGLYSGAELSLETSTNNPGGGNATPPQSFNVEVYGLDDGNPGENWAEGAIVWNNAPANNTSNNELGAGAAFLGSFTVPANAAPDTVTFSSPTLDAFLNQDTDGNATVILTREGGSSSANLAFSSKEGSLTAPTLSGDTQPGSILSVTTADGNGADSFIRQGQADTNFGSEGGVVIKGGNGGTTRKGYLRFDISEVPLEESVGAWLELETSTNNPGGGNATPPQDFSVNVYGLNDDAMGNDWDEGTLTWNNAPGNDAPGNGVDPATTTLLGTIEVLATAAPDEVLFSSDELLQFLEDDTDGLVTLLLQRTTGGSSNLAFATKENSAAGLIPTLNFAVAESQGVIPEPSSIAIWTLLGAVAGRRRRAGR